MKKSYILFILLLFLAVAAVAPVEVAATDGDVSSESITSFSETLSDDTLFYPDAFLNDTVILASSGQQGAGGGTGSYTDTQAVDGTDYVGYDLTAPYDDCSVQIDFTVPTGLIVEGFNYAFYVAMGPGDSTHYLQVYNFTASTWVNEGQVTTTHTTMEWHNGTYYIPDYWNTTSVSFRIDCTNGGSGTPGSFIDYAQIQFYVMTLADSDHYAESFADVSDWATQEGTGISSDGDQGYFDLPDDNAYDRYYSNNPSFPAGVGTYWEIRATGNDTPVYLLVYAYSTDGYGSGDIIPYPILDYLTTSGTTLKGYYDGTYAIECVVVIAKAIDSGHPVRVSIDYLRIGPADEMGWQHDGSTTEGVDAFNGGSVSSNGDYLSLTSDADGAIFNFTIDTTTTASAVKPTHYQFIEVKIHADDIGQDILLRAFFGVNPSTILSKFTTDAAYIRANVFAITGTGYEVFQIFVYDSNTLRVDWVQAYSIANYTYSSSGALTDEYFYVDGSSQLVVEKSAGGYMALHSDPTISVDGNTYNVINASITPQATGFTFHRQSDYFVILNQETRGEMPAAVLTDYYMKFSGNYDYTLSAIKFIEDGTAPSVVRSNANPPEPDDDESVTLSAVVTDAVEVYTVKFNAITSPAGFSDVDYSATEIADNLWTYSFSSGDLPTGYYCFKVIASDGANENALTTEPEFLDFTVRASEIVIEEITLIGAGSDFTMMQFSARINKDCTYTIYEESENNAEAATYTGTVSEPSFNLAWTKLSTTDTNVNFTIKFVNGSLTENYTSQYQVAQTALAINSYDWGFTQNEVLLNYDMTKGGTYTVYLDEVQDSTGAFTTGSNFVNWSRPSSTSPSEVRAAVKVTDGTTTLWMNRTYDEYSVTALSIQTLLLSTTGPNITIFVQTSLGNATITVYQDDVQKATGAEGTTLAYSKSTTAGTYNIAIKIFAGTTAGTKWHNDTYTVAIDYAWSTIYVFDQGDPATYIPWQSFDLYVNSSLIDENEFYDRTDYVYNIVLKDKFGDVVYNQTQAFARTYRLTLSMYKFKIKSYIVGKTVVTVVSSGGGSQSEVLFHESEVEWWLFASKTYYWTWTVQAEDGQTGTWGDGSHYFPAQGHNYETLSDTWYSPTQADGFELDAWGLKYVYDNLPQPGGDNDGDAEGGVLSAFDPRKNPLGPGTWLVIGFVGLGYMVYGLDDRNKTGEWPHTKARRRLKRKRGRGQYRPKEQKGSYG